MEDNGEGIITIECAVDTGKTPQLCRNPDLPRSVGALRYYAGWADTLVGQSSFHIPGAFAYTKREPVGHSIPWKSVLHPDPHS